MIKSKFNFKNKIISSLYLVIIFLYVYFMIFLSILIGESLICSDIYDNRNIKFLIGIILFWVLCLIGLYYNIKDFRENQWENITDRKLFFLSIGYELFILCVIFLQSLPVSMVCIRYAIDPKFRRVCDF